MPKKTFEALFRKREVQKEYVAIVDGEIQKDSGVIEKRLAPCKKIEGQTLWGVAKEGLVSTTRYQVLQKRKGVSVISCFPHTGRTHQIRVHLCFVGFPILGDTLYCRHFSSALYPSRHMLHAYRLQFSFQGKWYSIEAPIPSDMQEVMDWIDA